MTARPFTEEENRILNETLRSNKPDASKQSKDEQRIAELAKLSALALAKRCKPIAKEMDITVTDLKKLVTEKRRQLVRESKKKVEAPDADELWRSSSHIATHPCILDVFAKEFGKVVAGEAVNGKLLYLIATSRVFDNPMNAAIKGTSAGGKSEIRKRLLAFFPPEDIVNFTSLSEKALLYYEGDFSHKILSMGEASAADEQSFQDYLLRELMSERRLVHRAPQKVGNEIVTVTIEKNGPVVFLVTTTKDKLHEENETRLTSLQIDDSESQTRQVLDMVAQVDGLRDTAPIDYETWQNFQRWLAAGERRVVVPFAEVLSKQIPPVAVRLRRDAPSWRKARAWPSIRPWPRPSRQWPRQRPARCKPRVQAQRRIAKLLKLDNSATWRRLSAACNEGYIANLEQRRRMPGKYRATGQKIEPIAILPTTVELAEQYESSLSPPKSMQSCNRKEKTEISLGDIDCTDDCKPIATPAPIASDCIPIASPLAICMSLDGNEESGAIARLHGFSGESDDFSAFPPVCDHCGVPATPESPVQLCAIFQIAKNRFYQAVFIPGNSLGIESGRQESSVVLDKAAQALEQLSRKSVNGV
jgi:hypothetical protein